MTQALALLLMATQLLTLAINTPSLSQETRAQTVAIANHAIDVANAVLAPQSTATTTPPVAQTGAILTPSAPSFGALPSAMPQTTKDLKAETESTYVNVNGTYVNIFVFYKENGKAIENIPVTLTSDDGVSLSATTGPTGYRNGEAAAFFQYRPLKGGNRSVTLTAQGLSTIITTRGQIEKCIDTANDSECNSK